MDTIEVSNLNRQFLFRQSHVGQSKAKVCNMIMWLIHFMVDWVWLSSFRWNILQVARDAVLKFRPHINIRAYHANVKNPDFNVDFFKQFNVVLNGLDNVDARRHVNRLCLAAGVPLIESGTTGFLGQVIFPWFSNSCNQDYGELITRVPVATLMISFSFSSPKRYDFLMLCLKIYHFPQIKSGPFWRRCAVTSTTNWVHNW